MYVLDLYGQGPAVRYGAFGVDGKVDEELAYITRLAIDALEVRSEVDNNPIDIGLSIFYPIFYRAGRMFTESVEV